MFIISFIVQIILESLPISSSGHLYLFDLQMPDYLDRLALGPTVVMLMIYFYKEIFFLISDIKNQWLWICGWGLLIVMATSVTVFFYEMFDQLLFMHEVTFPIWIGFAITTALLFSLRWSGCSYDRTWDQPQPQFFKVFLLGVSQGCARLPGVSRLGITYTVACWLGFLPRSAFRISCALQIPLFVAGFLEGLVKVWRMGSFGFDVTPLTLLLVIVAMVVAYLLLWGIEALMVRGTLWYLGWYMLVVTLISFLMNNLEFFRFILVR